MTISTFIDKQELSTRITKHSTELLEDYVLWHQMGWTDHDFGELLGLSAKTVKNRYLADARKQGLIKASKMARPNCARNRAQTVENSDQDIERAIVTVHDNQSDQNVMQQPFASTEPTQTPAAVTPAEPKKKRPKAPDKLQMRAAQQRHIKGRLLPLVQQLVDLTGQVKVEQSRLQGAWEKDNMVFAAGFQRCVEYWDECDLFVEFAEAFGDPTIKTYADVLEATSKMFRRNSERIDGIRYATGCTPDPNKRDLRIG